jgi:hypothetical protein
MITSSWLLSYIHLIFGRLISDHHEWSGLGAVSKNTGMGAGRALVELSTV